ncbi:MAG TPA: MogA/MoaB family molybdenum cofactor biosynthesis protein [Myxococcales bacterium]|jgi:molybdenum cofactor biosynthesis protein B
MHDPSRHGTHHEHKSQAPASVACFVVTSSDTRDEQTDSSGALICELLTAAGHAVAGRAIIKDEPAQLVDVLERQAPAAGAQAVIISGGTGLGRRDTTVEVLAPRLEKRLDGFGELFRALSFAEIGTPAMMSRAVAGSLRGMIVFALPGSPAAARLALTRLILPELGHAVREMTR